MIPKIPENFVKWILNPQNLHFIENIFFKVFLTTCAAGDFYMSQTDVQKNVENSSVYFRKTC